MRCRARRVGSWMGLLLLAAWGCGADPNGPPLEAEVTNAVDLFTLVAPDVRGVTQDLMFSWTMTGTAARVTQASTITAGSGRLTIRDAAGALVFDRSLATGGAATTAAGTPGRWAVVLSIADYRGSIDLRIERP